MSSAATNPYLLKEGDQHIVTDEGRAWLSERVTNPTGQVYSFTGILPSHIISAAMARMSRRAGDMRICLLDEFSLQGDESSEQLLERVITGYGDDSVQQLEYVQFVVEACSNLMTKALEWGRISTAFIEQSTRYIFFDKKDADGKFLYFVPEELSPEDADHYRAQMDAIFEAYSAIVRGLTEKIREKNPAPEDAEGRRAWINSTRATACDAARNLLPVATKSTVGCSMSTQAAENLIMRLLSHDLEEMRQIGRMILEECRKTGAGSFLKRADLPERGLGTAAYWKENRINIRTLIDKYGLKDGRSKPSKKVSLLSFWPESETSLVTPILFPQSNLSWEELGQRVEGISEEDVEGILETYMGDRLNRRHRPGRAFEEAHFRWQIEGDYGTFRDLQRHRMVDDFNWQELTMSLGYDVPTLVTEYGFEEEYRATFALSEVLHGWMIERGYGETLAQYTTLLGNKMRYSFITNLREAFHLLEIRTGLDGHPGYRAICKEMYALLCEVYPITGKAMRFVDTREDPELVRQAAERATAMKLTKMGADLNSLTSE